MKNYFTRISIASGLAYLASSFIGCGLFFGNIRAPEVKSTSYQILDLSQTYPERWKKLTTHPSLSRNDSGQSDLTGADFAYQNKKSGSIISINSTCKNYNTSDLPRNLEQLSRELLMGFSTPSTQEQKKILIQGLPALQTTVQGKEDGETVTLRAITTKKNSCIYDLVYVARFEIFPENEKDFSTFVFSLKMK